jgi:hypothetical protein
MIEVYLFLAVFPVQILAMSLWYPVGFARVIRMSLAKVSPERLAEFYPGVDVSAAHERFLALYRAANVLVILIGLALLGWFMSYMQRPEWDEGRVGALLTAYFLLQALPIAVTAWFTFRFDKVHRRPPAEAKRKAVLQRRGPFDFVSPYVVLLAILSYFLFVAVNFYVARHPFPGYAGPLVNIGIVTLMFVILAGVLYWFLYLRKADPLQTYADRMRMLGMLMNAYVWMATLIPMFLAFGFAR